MDHRLAWLLGLPWPALAGIAPLVLLMLYLNLIASYLLSVERDWTIFQKPFQLVFVWSIPILGALLVIRFALQLTPRERLWRWLPPGLRGMVCDKPLPISRGQNSAVDNGIGIGDW